MNSGKSLFFLLCFLLGSAQIACAHFGMLIPSETCVLEKKDANLHLQIIFAHPMEGQGMDMEKPEKFQVTANGKPQDLLASLKPQTIMGHHAWNSDFIIKRPGVYHFAVQPKPYWEPAEDCFIVHYTKVIVPVFGAEEGWDEPLGLPTEIVPLTRPFGNYAGNVFQGLVLLGGKPAPNTEVEVELYNTEGKLHAPNDYYITQVVKTDANGVFTYAAPVAGWWGFAALSTSKETLKHEGTEKPIEMGAVFWTYFADPGTKK